MMSNCETYACVNLPWLYKNIDKRTRKAERHAKEKFIAARKIQRYFRKYRSIKRTQELWKQIVLMQSSIRRRLAQDLFYNMLEEEIDDLTVEWHNYAATVIQKNWRGYISRLKIHDHYKMKAAQLEAAKQLIICIAYKLHHLLRTRQIPGIYSIKNSNILSRVEQLLASLKFKEYNDRVRRIRAQKIKKVAKATEESVKSAIRTKVPYGPACAKAFKETKIEKMYSMLDTVDPVRKTQKQIASPPQSAGRRPKDIRDDVVSSMRRWKIVKDDGNLSVSPLIVSKPENIENFLGEIEAICHQKNLVNDRNACCDWTPSDCGGAPQGPCGPFGYV